MPRTSRRISCTSIYHIVLRGINQQIIFEQKSDFIYFKKLLMDCRDKYRYDIYAYCLMNNHVHLLIHSSEIPLEYFFKSLEVRYAYRFNGKYQRSGHLFQGRFFSIPVESESALQNTFRYIHNNPVKAGIVVRPENYPWSSCSAYYDGKNDEIVSVHEFYKLSGCSPEELRKTGNDAESCPVSLPAEKIHLSDERGTLIMQNVSGCISHSQFQKLPKPDRNRYIKILHEKGLSVRQMVRICGISKSTIERILGMKK